MIAQKVYGFARALTVLAAALTLAQPLHAADRTGEFAIKGAGLQTCGALATAWDRQSPDLRLYVGWIDGYLTGMNQHLDNTFDAAPWQTSTTLLSLTREACRSREGSARFMDVFNDLMRDFMPVRLAEKSAASGIRQADASLVLYDETVERLERRLSDEGYDAGEADGRFDQDTASALRAFQKDRGLDETGLPDQRTLFVLFVSTSG